MKLAVLLAASAAAITVAAPSFATVAIQQVNGGVAIVVPPSQDFGYGTRVTATDTAVLYQFSLASTYTLSMASFTNVSGFALNSVSIYSGLQTSQQSSGALFGPTAAFSANFAQAPSVVLGAGAYTIQVAGTSDGGSSVVGSSLSFSAAPEPATWGLMVLGFGAVGAALRTSRRKVVFA